MLADVSPVTFLRPRAEPRSAANALAGPSQYLPQVVIALPGKVYMVSQVMLGPHSDRKGRASTNCRQATEPSDRASVKHVRGFELQWQDERTVRLRWDAHAAILLSSDVVVELKVEREVDISPGITDLVLPSTLVGCRSRITSACERFMASRGDLPDTPHASEGHATAKAKADPKAKAGPIAKAGPKAKAKACPKAAAQIGSSEVEFVTHAAGPAAMDQTVYKGRYDFPDGGATPDGKVLIREALRTCILLFEQTFGKPVVVNNVIHHAKMGLGIGRTWYTKHPASSRHVTDTQALQARHAVGGR